MPFKASLSTLTSILFDFSGQHGIRWVFRFTHTEQVCSGLLEKDFRLRMSVLLPTTVEVHIAVQKCLLVKVGLLPVARGNIACDLCSHLVSHPANFQLPNFTEVSLLLCSAAQCSSDPQCRKYSPKSFIRMK